MIKLNDNMRDLGLLGRIIRTADPDLNVAQVAKISLALLQNDIRPHRRSELEVREQVVTELGLYAEKIKRDAPNMTHGLPTYAKMIAFFVNDAAKTIAQPTAVDIRPLVDSLDEAGWVDDENGPSRGDIALIVAHTLQLIGIKIQED